jgi:hypothetical protein
MTVQNQSLVLDLVEWVASGPRPYREVMDAWRTSCPRLTIWEDAVDQGLVVQVPDGDGHTLVMVSERGRECLAAARAAQSGTPANGAVNQSHR